MELAEATARELFTSTPVARLATAGADQRPHLVPVTFAVDGDRIYTTVDHKPKRSTNLRRLRNIRENPNVALLADHYAEDWATLWWVRVDGTARIVDSDANATRLLREHYAPYGENPPDGPLIVVSAARWTGWSASAR